MKLSRKLMMILIAVGVVPAVIIGVTSLYKTSNALQKQSHNSLISLRDVKKNEIEAMFQRCENDLGILVENVAIARQEAFDKMYAVQKLKKSQIEDLFAKFWNDISVLSRSDDVTNLFSHIKKYHDDMNTQADEKLDVQSDKYQEIYDAYTANLNKYTQDYGYHDMYLICAKHGHVVYSSARGSDLGENVCYGPLKDEGLGRVWQQVVQTKDNAIVDFSPYTPRDGEQTAFLAGPCL